MKQPSIFIAVALLALSLLGQGCSNEKKLASHLEKAERLVLEENYASAEIELMNALRIEPNNPQTLSLASDILYQQGRYRDAFRPLFLLNELAQANSEKKAQLAEIYLLAGDIEKATQLAKESLEADAQNSQAPVIIAEAVRKPDQIARALEILNTGEETPAVLMAEALLDLKAGRGTKSENAIDQLIIDQPQYEKPHIAKAFILISQSKLSQAEEQFDIAVENTTARSLVQNQYATFLETRLGKLVKSEAHLEKLIETAPDYLPNIAKLSETKLKLNKKEEAETLADQAKRLDPLDPTATRVKASCLASRQQTKEAIAMLEALTSAQSADLQSRYLLALLYMNQKESSKARKRLEEVAISIPAFFEAGALLANLQIQDGDVSEAIITLKRLSAANPNSKEAKILLAEAYNKQGNFAAATEIYKALDQTYGSDANLSFLSGVSYLRQANLQEARTSFEEALESNPNFHAATEQLTRMDIFDRKFEEALQRVNNSLEIAPDNSALLMIKGQTLYSMGRTEEAVESLSRSIEVSPENVAAYQLLSQLYIQQNDPQAAIEILKKSAERQPDNLSTQLNLATLLENQGDTEDAIQVYQTALQIDPESFQALNNIAYLISNRDGPVDTAVAYAEKARELAPSNPYTADTLGWILFKKGDYDRALALISEAAVRLGEIPEVAYHLGSVNYVIGNEAKAKEQLQLATAPEATYDGKDDALNKLKTLALAPENATQSESDQLLEQIEKDPSDTIARIRLGQGLRAKGDTEASLDYFRDSLRTSPSNHLAKFELATSLHELGETEEALNLAREAAQAAPNIYKYKLLLGKLAFASGDHRWAVSLIQDATKSLPESIENQLTLTESLLAVGRLNEAKQAAEKANAIAPKNSDIESVIQCLSYINSPKSVSIALPNKTSESSSLAIQLAHAIKDLESKLTDGIEGIVKTYPDQAQAKLNLARYLAKNQNTAARAFDLAKEAASIIDDTAESRAIQGIARFTEKNYESAVDLLKPLALSEKAEPSLIYYYGMALAKTGKSQEESLKQIQSAIDRGLAEPLLSEAAAALEKNN